MPLKQGIGRDKRIPTLPGLFFLLPFPVSMNFARPLPLLSLCSALLLGGCGGGGGPAESAQESHERRQALAASAEIDTEQLFRWAQLTWPTLFPDSPPMVQVQYQGRTYSVRAYANGNYLGVADGQVYGLGAFTGGALQGFGAVAGFKDQACAAIGCGLLDAGAVYSQVSVQAPTRNPRIDEIVFVGGGVSGTYFSGLLQGDVPSLDGREIHVVVDDPAQLFAPGGSLSVNSFGGWSYDLRLNARPLTRQGRFAGDLKVYACLDARCDTRLAGTPVTIPYDVRVAPGMTFSKSRVEVSAPFGSVPDPVVVDTVLGPLVKSANVSGFVPDPEYHPGTDLQAGRVSAELKQGWIAGTPLTISFDAAHPGRYYGTITLDGGVAGIDGKSGGSARPSVEVVYTVTDSPVFAAFAPSKRELREYPGQMRAVPITYTHAILQRSDLNFELKGVEYLNHPTQETDVALRTGWAVVKMQTVGMGNKEVTVQSFPCQERRDSAGVLQKHCLREGEYSAQVRVRATPAPGNPQTGSQDLLLPLRLSVRGGL